MPNLLIVDDNPADVDLLLEIFAELKLGVTCTVAVNGHEAIVLLGQTLAANRERPAAILLDLNMPRVGGREVLAYIRSTPALAAIPTVILTSSSSPKDRRECLAMGADAYYTKPGTLEQLNAFAHEIHGMISRGPDPGRSGAPPAAGGSAAGMIGRILAMAVAAWPLVRSVRQAS